MNATRFSQGKKRALVIASIVASLALGIPHIARNWVRLVQQGPVFVAIWVALAVAFVASGGGLASAGFRRQSPLASGARRARRLLILNGSAAVGMGLTVVVAAVRLLPLASWPVPISLCVLDIAHTVWSRRYLLSTGQHAATL